MTGVQTCALPILFVIEQWVELLQNNLAGHTICFGNASRVTYGVDDNNKVIGAVVYNFDTNIREAWICIAGVAETHRGQGLYSQLIQEVEKEARNNNMKFIASNIHIDNEPMIASAKKQNRELMHYRSKKQL